MIPPQTHKHWLFWGLIIFLLTNTIAIGLNMTQEAVRVTIAQLPAEIDPGTSLNLQISSSLGDVMILSIPTAVEVILPTGERSPLVLQQSVGGIYSAMFTPQEPGLYQFIATVTKDDEEFTALASVLVRGTRLDFTVNTDEILYVENGQSLLRGAILLQQGANALENEVELYISPSNLPFYRQLCTVHCRGACEFSCPFLGPLDIGDYELLAKTTKEGREYLSRDRFHLLLKSSPDVDLQLSHKKEYSFSEEVVITIEAHSQNSPLASATVLLLLSDFTKNEVSFAAQDIGNGTYQVRFVPNHGGDYSIRVTVQKGGIYAQKESTFSVEGDVRAVELENSLFEPYLDPLTGTIYSLMSMQAKNLQRVTEIKLGLNVSGAALLYDRELHNVPLDAGSVFLPSFPPSSKIVYLEVRQPSEIISNVSYTVVSEENSPHMKINVSNRESWGVRYTVKLPQGFKVKSIVGDRSLVTVWGMSGDTLIFYDKFSDEFTLEFDVTSLKRLYITEDSLISTQGSSQFLAEGTYVFSSSIFSSLHLQQLGVTFDSSPSNATFSLFTLQRGFIDSQKIDAPTPIIEGLFHLLNEQIHLKVVVPPNETLNFSGFVYFSSDTAPEITHFAFTNPQYGTDTYLENSTLEAHIQISMPFGREEFREIVVLLNGQSILPVTITSQGETWLSAQLRLELQNFTPGPYTLEAVLKTTSGIVDISQKSFIVVSTFAQPILLSGNTWNVPAVSSLEIPQRIYNGHAQQGDLFELSTTSGIVLATLKRGDGRPLNDSNGNGLPDTGILNPSEALDLLLEINIPLVEEGAKDEVILRAQSTLDPTVFAEIRETIYVDRPPISLEDISIEGIFLPTLRGNYLDAVAVSLASTLNHAQSILVRLTIEDGVNLASVYEKQVTLSPNYNGYITVQVARELPLTSAEISVQLFDSLLPLADDVPTNNFKKFIFSRNWHAPDWFYRIPVLIDETEGRAHEHFFTKVHLRLSEDTPKESLRIVVPHYEEGFLYADARYSWLSFDDQTNQGEVLVDIGSLSAREGKEVYFYIDPYASANNTIPVGYETIIDNTGEVLLNGIWKISDMHLGFYGSSYLTDENRNKGQSVEYYPRLDADFYEIFAWYPSYENFSSNVPLTIEQADKRYQLTLNEQYSPDNWNYLGTYFLDENARLIISSAGTTRAVVADAFRFIRVTTFGIPLAKESLFDSQTTTLPVISLIGPLGIEMNQNLSIPLHEIVNKPSVTYQLSPMEHISWQITEDALILIPEANYVGDDSFVLTIEDGSQRIFSQPIDVYVYDPYQGHIFSSTLLQGEAIIGSPIPWLLSINATGNVSLELTPLLSNATITDGNSSLSSEKYTLTIMNQSTQLNLTLERATSVLVTYTTPSPEHHRVTHSPWKHEFRLSSPLALTDVHVPFSEFGGSHGEYRLYLWKNDTYVNHSAFLNVSENSSEFVVPLLYGDQQFMLLKEGFLSLFSSALNEQGTWVIQLRSDERLLLRPLTTFASLQLYCNDELVLPEPEINGTALMVDACANLRIEARANAGDKIILHAAEEFMTLSFPSVDPVIILQPENKTYSALPIPLHVAFNETVDAWYELTYDSSTQTSFIFPGVTMLDLQILDELPEGSYQLRVFANRSGTVHFLEVSFTYDTNYPQQEFTLQEITRGDKIYTNASIVQAVFREPQIARLSCDQQQWSVLSELNFTAFMTLDITNPSLGCSDSQGEKIVYAQIQPAGNDTGEENITVFNDSIIFDATAPQITFTSTTLQLQDPHQSLDYSLSDTFGELASCSLITNHTNSSLETRLLSGNTSVLNFTFDNYAQGEYAALLSCMDAAGNNNNSMPTYFSVNWTRPPSNFAHILSPESLFSISSSQEGDSLTYNLSYDAQLRYAINNVTISLVLLDDSRIEHSLFTRAHENETPTIANFTFNLSEIQAHKAIFTFTDMLGGIITKEFTNPLLIPTFSINEEPFIEIDLAEIVEEELQLSKQQISSENLVNEIANNVDISISELDSSSTYFKEVMEENLKERGDNKNPDAETSDSVISTELISEKTRGIFNDKVTKVFEDAVLEEKDDLEFTLSIASKKGMKPGIYQVTTSTIIDGEEINSTRWFAWGLITVNTKKPLYHPAETAHILLVVLDENGYTVSGANITLNITSPDGTSFFYTTENAQILETDEAGVYEVSHVLPLVGTYGLFATSTLGDRTFSIESFVNAVPYYEYDILRSVPATIDPWQGPYHNAFTFNVYNDIENFDLVEVLPPSFIITDAGGGEVTYTDEAVYIQWNNVDTEAGVYYEAQTPLITPYMFELGNAYILYKEKPGLFSPTSRFYENRTWLFAIDPVQADTSQGGDVGFAIIDEFSFVMAYADSSSDDASFQVWQSNGSRLVAETDINPSVSIAGGGRIAIDTLNSTMFIASVYDGDGADQNYEYYIYDVAGNLVMGPNETDADADINTDNSIVSLGNQTVICWHDDNDGDYNMETWSLDTGPNDARELVSEVSVDTNVGASGLGRNLLDCAAINRTRIVHLITDNNANTIQYGMRSDTIASIVADTVLEAAAGGSHATLATLRNEIVVFLYYDASDDDIMYAVYDFSGDVANAIVGSTDLDTALTSSGRVAATEVDYYGSSYVALAWYDDTTDTIDLGIYDENGTVVTPVFTAANDIDTTYPLIDLHGANSAFGYNLHTRKFVLGYSRTGTNDLAYKLFDIDGTEWDGLLGTVNPSFDNLPINDTLDLNVTTNFSGLYQENGSIFRWYVNYINVENGTVSTIDHFNSTLTDEWAETSLSSVSQYQGIYNLTTLSTDSSAERDIPTLSASSFDGVEFRYRIVGSGSAKSFEIFWKGSVCGGYDSQCSQDFGNVLAHDDEWHTYRGKITDSDWSGTIDGIQFHPTNTLGVVMQVDYLNLFSGNLTLDDSRYITWDNITFWYAGSMYSAYSGTQHNTTAANISTQVVLNDLVNITNISIGTPPFYTGITYTARCLVEGQVSGTTLSNYPVTFQHNGSLLATVNTNSTGWASTTFVVSVDGEFNISCMVADNGPLFSSNPATNYSSMIFNATTIPSPILNSTLGGNTTDENLTCYNQSTDTLSAHRNNIIRWFKNDVALEALYYPFEHGPGSLTVKDYSVSGANGTITSAVWLPTGGKDGSGAYDFDGDADYILLDGDWINQFNKQQFSIEVVVNIDDLTPSADGEGLLFWAGDNAGNGWGGQEEMHLAINEFGATCPGFHFYYGDGGANTQFCHSSGVAIDTWYHAIVTYNDAGNNVTFYLDGQPRTGTTPATTYTTTTWDNAYIGRPGTAGQREFDGQLDYVRVWNYTLTPEQVMALYEDHNASRFSHMETNIGDIWRCEITENNGTTDGVHVISNNITILGVFPTWEDNITNLTTGSRNGDHIYFNITLNDSQGGGWYTFAFYNGTHWMNSSNYTWSAPSEEVQVQLELNTSKWKTIQWYWWFNDSNGNVNQTPVWSLVTENQVPTHGAPILNSTVGMNQSNETLTIYNQSTSDFDGDTVKNIIAWTIDDIPLTAVNMPFDSNETPAKDYSGNGNDGTVNSGAVWNDTLGFDGFGAYIFSGLANGISIPTSASMDSLANMTFTAWVETDNRNDADQAIFEIANGVADRVYMESDGTGNGFMVRDEIDGAGQNQIVTTYSPQNNVWTFVAFVMNGQNWTVYINGLFHTSSVETKTITNVNDGFTISIGYRASAGDLHWDGTIDDVRIYARALSPGQIYKLFENRTDQIIPPEMRVGETWGCELTPTDRYNDGSMRECNPLIVQGSGPVWALNKTNATVTTHTQEWLYFNVTLFDDIQGSKWNFSFFDGSIWTNTSGNWTTPQELTQELLVNTSRGKNISWYWLFNDSDGNVSRTPQWNFTIANAPPTQTDPILNSTSGFNLTTENLTAYNQSTADLDGDMSVNIWNWFVNNQSLLALYLPFENASSTSTLTKDYSPGMNNGTVSGATYSSTAGPDGRGRYDFDATNDYIDLGSTSEFYDKFNWSQFSLEVLLDIDDLTPDRNGEGIIFWVGDLAGNGWGASDEMHLSISDPNGACANALSFYFGDAGGCCPDAGDVDFTYYCSNALATNTWYHVVVTWDAANETTRMYVNGVQHNSVNFAGEWPYTVSNWDGAYIGQPGGATNVQFDGQISYVRMWNRSLSSTQVQALYYNRTNIITPAETEVGQVWSCNNTIVDSMSDGSTLGCNDLVISGYANLTNITYLTTPLFVGMNNTMACRVQDHGNSSGIPTYNVTFYQNGTLVGTRLANTTGWANITFVPLAQGQINLSCSIGDNSALLYTANPAANYTSMLVNTTRVQVNLTAPFNGTAVDRDSMSADDDDTVLITAATMGGFHPQTITFYANLTSPSITGQSNITLGSNTTNSNGDLTFRWDPGSLFYAGNYTLYAISQNTTTAGGTRYVHVFGSMHVTFTNATYHPNETYLRGEPANITATVASRGIENGSDLPEIYALNTTADTNFSAGTNFHKINLTYFAAVQNESFHRAVFNVDTNDPLGMWNVTLVSNASYFYTAANSIFRNYTVTSYANLTNISLISSPPVYVAMNFTIACRVNDHVNGSNLSGYAVSFYFNETLQATHFTNSTGWANASFSPQAIGEFNARCMITNNLTQGYRANLNANQSTMLLTASRVPITVSPTSNGSRVDRDNVTSADLDYVNITADTLWNFSNQYVTIYGNLTDPTIATQVNITLGTGTTNATGQIAIQWKPQLNIFPGNYTLYAISENTTTAVLGYTHVYGALNVTYNSSSMNPNSSYYRTEPLIIDAVALTTGIENGSQLSQLYLLNITANTTLNTSSTNVHHVNLTYRLANNTYAFYNNSIILPVTDPLGYWNVTLNSNASWFYNNVSLVRTYLIINSVPTHTNPLLNSTLGTNFTNENLTVYNQSTADFEGDPVLNVVEWFVNNISLMVLNMPFNHQPNATHTKDYTPNLKNGTLGTGTAQPTWQAIGGESGGGAYDFDGGDHINISGFQTTFNTNSFTIEALVNVDDFTAPRIIFWMGDDAGNGWGAHQELHLSVNHFGSACDGFNFWYGDGDAVVTDYTEICYHGTGTLTSDIWYHVAVTYDSAMQLSAMYVNGTLVAENSTVGDPTYTTTNWENVYIGKPGTNSRWFDGQIDYIRIWNRSLNPEQIRALYENNNATRISHNETNRTDIWYSCITPNDGLGDGIQLCSNNLTVRSMVNLTQVNLSTGPYYVAMNLTAFCEVRDHFLDQPVSGYGVSFFQNSTYLGNAITNATGWANLTLAPTAVGEFSVRCGVGDNLSQEYVLNPSGNESTLLVNASRVPISISSPANGTIVDRNNVSAADPDSITFVASTFNTFSMQNITFYANLTEPSIGTQLNITLGMNNTNSTGHATFTWKPDLNFYAGNYTIYAITQNTTTVGFQFTHVYGSLNLTSENDTYDPNATYLRNDLVRFVAKIQSWGIENGSDLWNRYLLNTTTFVNYSTDASHNHVINLSFMGATAFWSLYNSTFTLAPYDTPGVWNVTYISNASFFYTNTSKILRNYTLLTYANLTNLTLLNTTPFYVAFNYSFACRVNDHYNGSNVTNFGVSFYMNNTHLGNGFTNSSGEAAFEFRPTAVGEFILRCRISDNTSLFYLANTNANETNITLDASRVPVLVITPANGTIIDRNNVSATDADNITFVIATLPSFASQTITVYANLSQPAIGTQVNITLGTAVTNGSGNATFFWKPDLNFYAGNYTLYAISENTTTSGFQFSYVYGSLNVTSENETYNPNAVYTRDDIAHIISKTQSWGIENGSDLWNRYLLNTTAYVNFSRNADENHVINLSFMGTTPIWSLYNGSFIIPSFDSSGVWNVSYISNASFFYTNRSVILRNYSINSYANLTNITIHNSTPFYVAFNYTFGCKVQDHYNSSNVSGLAVDFYMNNTHLGSSFTNDSGGAAFTFRPTAVGDFALWCRINTNNSLFYTANPNANETNLTFIASRVPVSLTAPANGTNVDRNNVSTLDPDRTTLVAATLDSFSSQTITFLANLTLPSVPGEVAIIIGTNTTNGTGHATFDWKPGLDFYAGNYTLYAFSQNVTTISTRFAHIYGALNVSFTNDSGDPNLIYGKGQEVILKAKANAWGRENGSDLWNRYYLNITADVNHTVIAANVHVVNLTFFNATGNDSHYNGSFVIPTTDNNGLWNVTYVANASFFYSNATYRNYTLNQYGNLTNITLATEPYYVALNVTVACQVRNNLTNVLVQGYNVSFYVNNTFQGNTTTDAGGWANFSIRPPAVGQFNATCMIVDHPEIGYQANPHANMTSIIANAVRVPAAITSPTNLTRIDRDNVSTLDADSVTIVVATLPDFSNQTITFYANLTYPNKTSQLNISLGTNTTNVSGHATFEWKPQLDRYAGNYTFYAISQNTSTNETTNASVIGALNVTFYNNITDPYGTYHTNENITWWANVTTHGPENGSDIGELYYTLVQAFMNHTQTSRMINLTYLNASGDVAHFRLYYNLTVDHPIGVWNVSTIFANATYMYNNYSQLIRNFTHIGVTFLTLLDGRQVWPSENVTCRPFNFFANYSNMTGRPVIGASCNVNFTDILASAMNYDVGHLYYNHTREFIWAGDQFWNVTCSAPFYQTKVAVNWSLVSEMVNFTIEMSVDNQTSADRYSIVTSLSNNRDCMTNITQPQFLMNNHTNVLPGLSSIGSILVSGEHVGNITPYNISLSNFSNSSLRTNISYRADYRLSNQFVLGLGLQ